LCANRREICEPSSSPRKSSYQRHVNFRSDLAMNLLHPSIRSFEYVIQCDHPFKALLITDLHIGRHITHRESIHALIGSLRSVIELESPTVIFILGDIIHFRWLNVWSCLFDFYSAIESLGVPIHSIPGNHDRYLHARVAAKYNGDFVHPHQSEAIIISPPNGGRKVVLGHDLCNDKRVHGFGPVREWFAALRSTFADVIPEDALLIVGHVHEHLWSADGLSQSLPPFSADIGIFAYGILEFDDHGQITYCFRNDERIVSGAGRADRGEVKRK
jgi:hypothetical protein